MIIATSNKSSLMEYFQKICVLNNGKIQDYDLISKLMNKNKFLKKIANKN